MKRTSILFFFFFGGVPLFLFGQFNAQTESAYLKLINNQGNKPLVEDNIKNATFAAEQFLSSGNSRYKPLFFAELSRSFALLGDNQRAFFYAVVQRTLFPQDGDSVITRNAFYEIALACNLTGLEAENYWISTSVDRLPEELSGRGILALKLLVQLHSDALCQPVYDLGVRLKGRGVTLPGWFQHWMFYTTIGLKEKHKKAMVDFSNASGSSVFELFDDQRRDRIYSQAIDYYIRSGALRHAESLMEEYKREDLSLFCRMGLMGRKAVLKWHLIFREDS